MGRVAVSYAECRRRHSERMRVALPALLLLPAPCSLLLLLPGVRMRPRAHPTHTRSPHGWKVLWPAPRPLHHLWLPHEVPGGVLVVHAVDEVEAHLQGCRHGDAQAEGSLVGPTAALAAAEAAAVSKRIDKPQGPGHPPTHPPAGERCRALLARCWRGAGPRPGGSQPWRHRRGQGQKPPAVPLPAPPWQTALRAAAGLPRSAALAPAFGERREAA